ncbi:MAG: hypothetical protein EHM48_00030 [Planctomycetaceae bacterium]|nr:MAG: hypothetical protein EHM48_00030 [Planctomycetaceae bacterium]
MPDFAVRTYFGATDRISPAFKRMGFEADRFGRRAENSFDRAGRANSRFRTMLGAGLGALGIVGGLDLIRQGIMGIISEASNLENAVSDFTTLTGSVENAQQVVRELQTLGAETPFEFGDLSAATRMMFGFGAATRENLIPTLRMLGDVAQGNAQRLDSITLAFSQIQAGGRASMQDVNQLINAGVPILSELGRMWGVNVAQARRMVAQGRATGEVVTEAFQRMTGAGGMFHNGMQRASMTLSGRFSTFIDNVKVAAAAIGTALMPQLKSALDTFIGWAEAIGAWATANKEAIGAVFSAIGRALGVIANLLPYVVGWFIAYKIAIMGVAAWHAIIVASGWIKYLWMMRSFITAATIKQWLWNAAMTANPIGLVIVAVAALITIGILLYRNWDVVKEKFTAAGQAIWGGLQMIGRGIMTAVMAPINLLISGIIYLLELASRIPGVGERFAAAAASVRQFQAAANSAAGSRNLLAPNASQVQAQQVNVSGNINIAGAPQGSSASRARGSAPVNLNVVGANP